MAGERHQSRGAEGEGTRALIIDDYAASRTILRTILAAFKVEADEATTLEEARTLLLAQRVDVIFLDLFLGAESGETLLADFIDVRPEDRPQIIIVSADPPEENAGLAGPYDAIIGKPVNVALLARLLAQMGLMPVRG